MSTYINVGRLWDGVEIKGSAYYDSSHNYPLNGSHCVIISTNNACSADGIVGAVEAWFKVHFYNNEYDYTESKWHDVVINWKFATFTKSGNVFTQNDIQSSWGVTTLSDIFLDGLFSINPSASGVSIDIDAGDYIGIILENDSAYADMEFFPMFGGGSTEPGSYVYSSNGSSSPYTCSVHQFWDGSSSDMQEGLVYGVVEIPDGDLPNPNYNGQNPETCYTYTTDIDVPGWYNYYGYLRFDEILTSPYRATVDVKTPWLEEHHDQTMEEGVTYVFRNPINRSECYSVTLNSLFVSGSTQIVSDLTECYYYETENNERWVSNDGSDSNSGKYHTQPFATVTKAITDISEGGLIHIKEGLYGETGLSSISKSIQLSPENIYWEKDNCTVLLCESSTSTTTYGSLTSSQGFGGSGVPDMTGFATSIPVTTSGLITNISARVTVYTGTVDAIVLRNTTGTTYEVVYREEFDTYNGGSSDEVATTTCSIPVESGDIVGVTINTDPSGAVLWRTATGTGWRGGYYEFTTAIGNTLDITSYSLQSNQDLCLTYDLTSI
jgi:hypothetical protein